MKNKETYLKELKLAESANGSTGEFIKVDNEEFYLIRNYDQMRPFFMSLVSHSDHWLFISTTGGLSAGRKNEESALFPYYTDDKIRDESEVTGSKTIFRVHIEDKEMLWEPFSNRFENAYDTKRNLYKNRAGNKIIFEEVNHDLGLAFQYGWSFSEKYGFVRKASLHNNGTKNTSVEALDGLQNILPSGVNSSLQSRASNLVNAYKKSELIGGSGLGLFMLSAIIVDKAEPSEALKTSTVWSYGLKKDLILLSSLQLNAFRNGSKLNKEDNIKAERGAYFVYDTLLLKPDQTHKWGIVADVNQDHSDVIQLIEVLDDESKLIEDLQGDIDTGKNHLLQLVGKADGLQHTNDKLSVGRHYSNVLFNIMRGGIFDEGYDIEIQDFKEYALTINQVLVQDQSKFFESLGDRINYYELLAKAESLGNSDVTRLCREYLPLTFSRRHGDPSRPWNKFNINIKDEEGKKLRTYEGNWRDIFQNWEALAISYPNYIVSMISKFVNASTIDGYNPYRITREGIDWEVIEPDDPWSYIGYWGDHQIIYLEKLLEIAGSYQEEKLLELLADDQFVYANVPYRIKDYEAIVKDPQDTIDYDYNVENETVERVDKFGSDGKLVFQGNQLLRANLIEKLLVTFLTKLSNYIPEGGIWLNTQRPEWNDANNALVGNGVSMVTLCYMRRFSTFMYRLLDKTNQEFSVNKEVADFFYQIHEVFSENLGLLNDSIKNEDRKLIIDDLGRIGESYRKKAYDGFVGKHSMLSASSIQQLYKVVIEHIDHSIRANERKDNLFHAYNLLSFDKETAAVDHLYEMLEGQVAVLSSGLLDMKESLEVLDALKASKIYREDQYSYMLYPNRTLPRFLEKNNIPADFVNSSKLAQELLSDGNKSLIYSDVKGGFHFNGSFNNVGSLRTALEKLKKSGYADLVEKEFDMYLEVFEQMFNHKAFTGRSGTFFGYEGLGSIYWHMVSKLLLAVQENIYWGWEEYQGTSEMGRMVDHYYEIRAGIGINKDPDLYGSIPTDPYSHTPGGRGVQQPGMTGQVKEDILNRWAELGVYVKNGEINFAPIFLSEQEYLSSSGQFEYFNLKGEKTSLDINPDQLAFTYCQVPIIYEKGHSQQIEITYETEETELIPGKSLNKEASSHIFSRAGKIKKIKVTQ